MIMFQSGNHYMTTAGCLALRCRLSDAGSHTEPLTVIDASIDREDPGGGWPTCGYRCIQMDVSKNRGTPKSSILIGVFHYKPSILGYPYFWKHPNVIKCPNKRLDVICHQLEEHKEVTWLDAEPPHLGRQASQRAQSHVKRSWSEASCVLRWPHEMKNTYTVCIYYLWYVCVHGGIPYSFTQPLLVTWHELYHQHGR